MLEVTPPHGIRTSKLAHRSLAHLLGHSEAP